MQRCNSLSAPCCRKCLLQEQPTELLEHTGDRQVCQARWAAQQNYLFAWGPPNFFGRVTPQNQARQTHRRCQVRDSRIVPDKGGTAFQQARELGKPQTLGYPQTPGRQGSGKPLQAFAFSFA